MANAFSESEVIFFTDFIEAFNNNNVVGRNVKKYTPNMQTMEQAGLTVNRPVPYISTSSTGRDVSSDYKDVTGLVVPTTLAESDIHNVPWILNAVELNDPTRREEKARSAARQLSSKVDTICATAIVNRGSQVVTSANAMDTYEELSVCESVLLEQGVDGGMERKLVVNPRDAAKMTGVIAGKSDFSGRTMQAYERSYLTPVAGFDTMRGSIMPTITGSSSSGVTVDGAAQVTTPAVNTDNRTQTLTVSGSHGLVAGDCFTIAGVYAVNMQTKQSTGQLRTFRVVSVATNDLTITPAIIPADGASQIQKEYANVNTAPANGAAITVLNTTTKMASAFWVYDAVELIHGRLALDDLASDMPVMRETTDSGIEIVFAKQSNIDTLVTKYRFSIWCAANVLQPEMAGIALGSQT